MCIRLKWKGRHKALRLDTFYAKSHKRISLEATIGNACEIQGAQPMMIDNDIRVDRCPLESCLNA